MNYIFWLSRMTTPTINSVFLQQLDYAKKLLTISPTEDKLLKDIPNQLNSLIISICHQFSYPVVDIVPVGSSQRQTYLPGNRDIDIFVRLDTADRSMLEQFASQVIPAIASSLHTSFEIKYAENPYGVILYPLPDSQELISIDIVVTIWLKDQLKLDKILPISGMARTPFHMFYLQEHIRGLEEEVRLFKYWAKQKKLYRQSGFTGFISELLIIIFDSFQNILSQADEICSLTYDFHDRSPKSLRKKFANFPMILMDPVDSNRNAAAGIHGVLGSFHLQRFTRLAHESLIDPSTLWSEYSLSGIVFTLKITFSKNITVKNDEEYYSRIIKVLGLIYRALFDQEIIIQDALIDVKDSTLSFTTNSSGGGILQVKGPPVHMPDHAKKFQENNPDWRTENGFYWSTKQQLTVQEIVYRKINNPDFVHDIYFI